MTASLQITATAPDPAILDLPWHIPLEDWPAENLAALPRGISRHVVRFVKLSGRVIAVKEIGESVAYREYELLRALSRIGVPSVEPVGVITGRQDPNGERLEAVLVTEHLQFSLPYRALFSQSLQPDTTSRLVDALTVLLVRLHLAGFYWGDVSLSNTLFRRDAGAFAAYLVDAETGDLHQRLSDGQRSYDLEIARVNIIGELMDLEAGDLLESGVDTIAVGSRLVERYAELWDTLTGPESFGAGDPPPVAGAEGLGPSERVPQLRVPLDEPGADRDGVDAGLEQIPGFEVHQLADDVDPGDLQVVAALAVRQPLVQVPGLRVHQVGREGPRVAAEQGVRQGHVSPVEACQVQPDQQHGEGVDQPARGVRLQALAEQSAVGQGELQMLGDQYGLQPLAVRVLPAGDHPDRFHARHADPAQCPQQLVLAVGDALTDLLHGDDAPGQLDEPHHVPGDAAGEGGEVLGRPVLQRDVPGQVEDRRVRCGRGDLQ